jgi:hypothetical protein
MVGLGKGITGTPGGSGGWPGGDWMAGCAATATGWPLSGWLRGATGALGVGRVATADLWVADDSFRAEDTGFGRAAFTVVGFALTFEVVTPPFALERRSELRGAPLPIQRYRSISLTQV